METFLWPLVSVWSGLIREVSSTHLHATKDGARYVLIRLYEAYSDFLCLSHDVAIEALLILPAFLRGLCRRPVLLRVSHFIILTRNRAP